MVLMPIMVDYVNVTEGGIMLKKFIIWHKKNKRARIKNRMKRNQKRIDEIDRLIAEDQGGVIVR